MSPDGRRAPSSMGLDGGLLAAVTATALLLPLAECPKCVPYWIRGRDASGRPIPGYPISAVPTRCPVCDGTERVAVLRKWTYGARVWYP